MSKICQNHGFQDFPDARFEMYTNCRNDGVWFFRRSQKSSPTRVHQKWFWQLLDNFWKILKSSDLDIFWTFRIGLPELPKINHFHCFATSRISRCIIDRNKARLAGSCYTWPGMIAWTVVFFRTHEQPNLLIASTKGVQSCLHWPM